MTTRRTLVVTAALVVVLAAVVAVAASGGDDDPRLAAEVGTPTVTGAALPELATATDDPAVGAPAPVAEGVDFAGDPVTVGEPGTVVAFVAHWCPHCRAEVPRLVEWLLDGDLPAGSIELVSTGVDRRAPNHPRSAWLAAERWPGDVLLDAADGAVARAYGLSAYPFFVAVDGEGRVAARVSGELTLQQVQGLVATVG